jgi:hypothetical protein
VIRVRFDRSEDVAMLMPQATSAGEIRVSHSRKLYMKPPPSSNSATIPVGHDVH